MTQQDPFSPESERKAILAKAVEWRAKADALDTTATILEVEDQHHDASRNRVMIERLRAVAVAYRVCAADLEGVTCPF